MLLIHCPYCGPRAELEFSYGGQAHIARPAKPESVTPEQWVEFLYLRSNPRGLHAERWRHVRGCARYFNALRNTQTDQFIATYRTGDAPPTPPGSPQS